LRRRGGAPDFLHELAASCLDFFHKHVKIARRKLTEKRIRPDLRLMSGPCRVDETCVKINGKWKYRYRAVDSTGQPIDFMSGAKRDASAAKRLFRKMLKAAWRPSRRVINVDKNPACPPAVEQLKPSPTARLRRSVLNRLLKWL
jgi:transposase, IS6 family